MKLSLYGAMAVAMIFVSSTTNAIAIKDDQLQNLSQTEVDTEHDFLDDLMNCGGKKAF